MSWYDRLAKLAQLLDSDGNPPGGTPSGAAGGGGSAAGGTGGAGARGEVRIVSLF